MSIESRTALGRGPALAIPGSIIAGMESIVTPRPRRRTIRLDVALLATAGVLLGVSLLPFVDPSLNIVIVDRTFDVALTSLTLVATAGLTALALLRHRETGRLAFYLQASSFALWAAFSAITVTLILVKLDGRLGLSLGLPEQLPTWISGMTRIFVGGLFLASALAAIRGLYVGPSRALRGLLAPVGVLVLLAVLLYPARELLPPLIEPAGIEALLAGPSGMPMLPGMTILSLILVVTNVVLLVAGVVLYRVTWARGGPVSDSFTAVGLAVLAVAELQYAFWPSVYAGLVTVSDFLRLVAYTVLVAGTVAEQRADLRALRKAYSALDRMRATEAERAALEERTRLAREIHDGLAQHLWFAKLKLERLNASLREDERPLAGEVVQALDAAIVEARQALVTMRSGADRDVPLADLLARTMDEFSRSSGVRVDVSSSAGLPRALPPRSQVELLRIVQEALTNVRKHADATVVRARAEVEGRELVVSVADNGRGFAPDHAQGEGLGIRGMEERARLIGGELRVASELAGGTSVEVRLPLHTASLPGVPDVTEPVPTPAATEAAEAPAPDGAPVQAAGATSEEGDERPAPVASAGAPAVRVGAETPRGRDG
jgi:signal transduction histidine kinase